MVIRPRKYFSLSSVIHQFTQQESVANNDIVTWNNPTSYDFDENSDITITLDATSSAGGTITYTIRPDSIDDGFNIIGNTLNSNIAFDFENPIDSGSNNTYIIGLLATSSAGGSQEFDITINIDDVDEPNTLLLTGTNVTVIDDTPYSREFNINVYNSEYNIQDNVFFNNNEATGQFARISSIDINMILEVAVYTQGGGTFAMSDGGISIISGGLNTNSVVMAGRPASLNTTLNTLNVSTDCVQLVILIFNPGHPYNDSNTINILRANRAVEQQTITFSAVPMNGTWYFGTSAENYEIFNYDATDFYIQNALRANTPITNIWGTSLTVSGNYTIGFTVTASKYGNLSPLFKNENTLTYDTFVTSFVTENQSSVSWNDTNNIVGSVDNSFIYYDISSDDPSHALTLGFKFAGFPLVVPNGIEITVYGKSDSSGHIKDNGFKLISTGYPDSPDASQNTYWESGGEIRTYGGPNQLWGISQTASIWQDFLVNSLMPSGTLLFQMLFYNYDAYPHTIFLDAVNMKVYYTTAPTITISTITNGY